MASRQICGAPAARWCCAVGAAAWLVASGEIEIGPYQVGDILPYQGAKVVGLLPAPLQTWTIITAAVAADSAAPKAAAAFIAMLREPGADAAWTAAGLEPLRSAK